MQRVRCVYFRDGLSACNKRAPGSGCAAIEGLNRNVHAVLGGSPHCIAAHPSDMCVAMVAIDATIHVQGPNGKRDIAFDDFHLLPGDTPWKEHALDADEMITHVTLDAPMPHSWSAYLKLRDRASYQFALATSRSSTFRNVAAMQRTEQPRTEHARRQDTEAEWHGITRCLDPKVANTKNQKIADDHIEEAPQHIDGR
ncbi:hypothetical protein HDG38_006841 [Paraburkholderia sp. WSM4177]|nr:hypothetical protein [Paraburkholderia sp. WSM4177]MBB5483693.1 hypothetical protein [Paraburkholderia sp. WSM4180]